MQDLSTEESKKTQTRQLSKLLRRAKLTQFGKKFQFESISKSINLQKAFSENVSIHTYESFKEWIVRARNEGVSNLTWPGVTKFYAMSSGTTSGTSKYLPVTFDFIKSIQKSSLRQYAAVFQNGMPRKHLNKGVLTLNGSSKLMRSTNGYLDGYLSGIMTNRLPKIFRNHYLPGHEISELQWEAKSEEIIKMAKSWDVACICGVTSWTLRLLDEIVSYHGISSIHEIWPNFKYFIHGGVSFNPYKLAFKKLTAQDLFLSETYLASEGFFAYQRSPEQEGMNLLLDCGIFFEFIPFTDNYFDKNGMLKSDNIDVLTVDELEFKKDYAMVISTTSGLWRYLIGDVIRVTSLNPMLIRVVGRTNFFLNTCGEQLSMEQLDMVIEKWSQETAITIDNYCIIPKMHNNTFVHHWYLGVDSHNYKTPYDNASLIDSNLRSINDNYKYEREVGSIGKLQVSLINKEVFISWLRDKDKIGGQHKFPRIVEGKKGEEWENFVMSSTKNG